jgi:hypothetical protein
VHKSLLPALALAALVGCATPEAPKYTALYGCDTAASVIERLAVQRRAGLLEPEVIERVNQLITILNPVCASPTPPANAETIVTAVLDELEALLVLSLTSERSIEA